MAVGTVFLKPVIDLIGFNRLKEFKAVFFCHFVCFDISPLIPVFTRGQDAMTKLHRSFGIVLVVYGTIGDPRVCEPRMFVIVLINKQSYDLLTFRISLLPYQQPDTAHDLCILWYPMRNCAQTLPAS